MFLRKGLLFFALFGLLICTGETTAGPNANAVLSLDLIADGGVGNERDDGVTSGTVSGQGTRIAVEVFAKGVTTSLLGLRVEFDFDASVLTYVGARSSASLFTLQNEATGTTFGAIAGPPATLSESGFLARAEFTTAVDVTGREFSIGIKSVILADSQTSSDEITTTEVIRFNTASSPDFNNDGIVDLLDYSLFRNQWNTRAGGPNWDAKFDLNVDGVIDLGDYAIFRDNWNKTFPVSPSDRGDDEEIVSIPDMNLRAVVEDSLNKASGETITRAEMATLTLFVAVNANISDLTGLEFATNLTALALVNNSISDLAPLSGLTNLIALLLDSDSITDLSPLSSLTNLQRLILSNNSISDLTPLSGLTNLQRLWLQNNSISDLSPLVANTGLGSGDDVDVRDNPLSATSISTHIPTLQDRGVEISFDPTPVSNDPTPVSIPDANLRVAIEAALGKSSGETITRGDISILTRLDLNSQDISGLTGLEFATNLTTLSLQFHSVSDLSPLSGLTNLTRLWLGYGRNTISDFSPLAGLTNLTFLDLQSLSITDLSPLSGLTNLETLWLSSNSISDLSPLSGLTNLRVLSLKNNSISDLAPLVANTGLGSGDEVNVRDNPLSATSISTHIPTLQDRGVAVLFTIDDPTPVSIPDANLRAEIVDALDKSSGETITRSDMSNLTRLVARNANISDVTGLEFAINLTSLDLGTEFVSGEGHVNSNHISDLSPVSGLNNLTSLDLDRNSISDVSALSGMVGLRTLRLEGNLIEDLSPLSGLTSLTFLDLDRNTITDILPLSELTSLARLDLSENTISDLTPLSSLTNLERLWLFNNLITDLSPLSGLTNLITLNLGSNTITDVSALSGLTSLRSLYLFSNSITDVSALSGLTSLTNLRLSINSITDVSALSGLTNLETLWLRSNSITDLEPLVANTGLGSGDDVDVRNNPLGDASINTHIPALQERGVAVQF